LLPPLRERKEDIPALVQHFAEQVCAQNNWKPVPFSVEVIEELQKLPWAGNIRELRNVVERLILLATDGEVAGETLRVALPRAPEAGLLVAEAGSLGERVQRFEREVILTELKRNHHHVTNAARVLGLERSHLYKKAEQLGIDLQALRNEPGDTHEGN